MSIDEQLAGRVRDALREFGMVGEDQIPGGLAFSLRGHRCLGVVPDGLIVRVGPDAQASSVNRPHARACGKRGWRAGESVLVEPAGLRTKAMVTSWVKRGANYVRALPPNTLQDRSRRPAGKKKVSRKAAARGERFAYAWDNDDPQKVFARKPALRKQIARLNARCAWGFGIAHAEWIARRFDGAHDVSYLFDLIQAAWVATANPLYLRDPKSFRTKILRWSREVAGTPEHRERQPIWLTYDLVHAAGCGLRNRRHPPTEFVYHLSCLAQHVVADKRAFGKWQRAMLERFTTLSDARLACGLAPASADPEQEFGSRLARRLFSEFLATVRHTKNRFLASPAELREAGFKGRPYGK